MAINTSMLVTYPPTRGGTAIAAIKTSTQATALGENKVLMASTPPCQTDLSVGKAASKS